MLKDQVLDIPRNVFSYGLICIPLVLLISGCGESNSQECLVPISAVLAAPNNPPKDLKNSSNSDAIAKVGDKVITKGDFEEEWNRLPEAAQTMGDAKSTRKKLLDRMIEQELLFQEALKQGVAKDSEILREIRRTTASLVLKKFVENQYKQIKEPYEGALKVYYEKHRSNYFQENAVQALLFSASYKNQAEEKPRALAKCRNVVVQASTGKDFKKILAENLENTSDADKGTWILASDPRKKLRESLFLLKENEELTGIIEENNACYVAKKLEQRKEGTTAFELVKEQIRSEIQREARNAALEGLADELRKRGNVEIVNKQEP